MSTRYRAKGPQAKQRQEHTHSQLTEQFGDTADSLSSSDLPSSPRSTESSVLMFRRLAVAQQQTLLGQISHVQGNQYAQRLVATLRQPQSSVSLSLSQIKQSRKGGTAADQMIGAEKEADSTSAQRVVQRVCSHCAQSLEDDHSKSQQDTSDESRSHRKTMCPECERDLQRQTALAPQRTTTEDNTVLQRLSKDYQVRGRYTPKASDTERWKNFVFFDLNGQDLDAPQQTRVKDFVATLSDPAQPVTLIGFASEEGEPGINAGLVNARIDAVAHQLAAEGYTGTPIRTSRAVASQGRIAYREWRSVEMLKDKSQSSRPDCSSQPQTTPFSMTQRITFLLAKATALGLIQNTVAKLRQTPPPAETLDLAKRLFGPSPPLDTIADGLDKVHSALSAKDPDNVTLGTPCHKSCQGGTLAFVSSGTDEMTLCPAFFESDLIQQARILAHESAHISTGLDVTDRAYGWERLINVLGKVDPAEALNNADSYTLLVLLSNGLIGVTGTEAPTDDLSALPNTEAQENVEEALAYVQRWNTRSRQQLTWYYGLINQGIADGKWIDPSLDMMQFIGTHFGQSINPGKPRDADRAAVAAIYDRFGSMRNGLGKALQITVATGHTSWEPGPGTKVAIHPSLWKKDTLTRVRLLLQRLATATPDISPGLVSAYVDLSDKLRQERGDGP